MENERAALRAKYGGVPEQLLNVLSVLPPAALFQGPYVHPQLILEMLQQIPDADPNEPAAGATAATATAAAKPTDRRKGNKRKQQQQEEEEEEAAAAAAAAEAATPLTTSTASVSSRRWPSMIDCLSQSAQTNHEQSIAQCHDAISCEHSDADWGECFA